jgi:hypothetical protein
MSELEDLTPNAGVRGILPDCPVSAVRVQRFGSEALEPTYKDRQGRVANQLLDRHDEPRLGVVENGRPWSFDGDGALFRLISEAHRLRPARWTSTRRRRRRCPTMSSAPSPRTAEP